ncbi:putative death-receptor fusion protein (DUF2428) domain-containing protein [Phthorimaea operculella]|nr:putative death-receptor fusion protein (DUF2428) domain-containing protein [Phthorimaea operculella]
MEENNKLLLKIKVPTLEITTETIQDILIAAKRQQEQPEHKDFWNEVTHILWNHLQQGLCKFDDQLLCATCFYTVLASSDNQIHYISCIVNLLIEEIHSRDKATKENEKTLQAVSLMYGMFQSSFLVQDAREIPQIEQLLRVVFHLLAEMAYDYSKYTFIVFKTMNSFKKLIGTHLQNTLFDQWNNIKLLHIVNNNWENPITGVRDLNKGIFQSLISAMDEQMFRKLLRELYFFYWNKAKYLMYAEIISNRGIDKTYYAPESFVNALVESLHKPGLVSAGADMYFALLKKLKSEKDWFQIFKKPIIELLCSVSKKGIENFNNYWILTTFKTYPGLAETLLKELEGLESESSNHGEYWDLVKDTESILYSTLCIIKQANKLGVKKLKWENTVNNYVEKSVTIGLEHTNNKIRLMAFDALCNISNGKTWPSKTEYENVLNFVENNVNSDCAVLRIGMLKSLSGFLTQVHMSYLNYHKDGDETEDLKQFCYQFQNSTINNLKIGGNYQRKVTSIKLAQTFLNGIKEVPRKRQKQIRKCEKSFIQMLKDDEKWLLTEDEVTLNLTHLLKDPAEDIRENVVQLLLDHYSEKNGETDMMNQMIDNALSSMSSKFFYEINCGRSVFKLIINILIQKEHDTAKFRTVDDVFNFAFRELIAEYKMKREIVKSIEMGKQLHSFMSIIQTVLEVCLQKKNIFNISNETLMALLEVLSGISNQFALESDSSTSSDFSKMSDMVNSLIAESGHGDRDENDPTKISGLHQIVLNCLWLNVKGACELSSLLIKYQHDDKQAGACEKALDIICHVLETCRHKGAIEAAGAALGLSIQHLTSMPENTELSKLPLRFLQSKLNELISQAAQMASVTRRGAGLSIMVHRIVSNDAKRGKVLFHYFMTTILETCNKADEAPKQQNMDNVQDLPKAVYIHFLTRIVTDSSLASDMMFYSAELAELAFGNLTSPYWQIRNAALQLYGALIPKLIGQKKASGCDEETVPTVACDELRTHSPKLWKHIQRQLKNDNYEDKIQYHSNLVPILNMLANVASRYRFAYIQTESIHLNQKKEDEEMLEALFSLLDSPIYTVRRLAAKSIPKLFYFYDIHGILLKEHEDKKQHHELSENGLHGCVMLIDNLCKQQSRNMLHLKPSSSVSIISFGLRFNQLPETYGSLLSAKDHCYVTKEVFERNFDSHRGPCVVFSLYENTFEELSLNSHKPGIYAWANTRIRKYFQRMGHAHAFVTTGILKIIITQKESETYLSMFLDLVVENDKYITQEALHIMTCILLLNENKFKSSITWKFLYKLSQRIDLTSVKEGLLIPEWLENISDIFRHLKESKVSYKLRYMIPFAARISVCVYWSILDITKIIGDLINPENADVEMRYIAALANNEFSSDLKRIPEQAKIDSIKSAVILLQVEDEDVRILSTEFYKRAMNSTHSLQPYICLHKIMHHTFLDTILSEDSIHILAVELEDYLSKVCSKNVDEYNPFANDSSNIYLEANVLRQLIEAL